MIRARALELLERVASGQVAPEDALHELSLPPTEPLPFATIDHHRALRQGYPEVILAEGKAPEHVTAIAERIAAQGDGFLVTRASEPVRGALLSRFPDAVASELGRTVRLPASNPTPRVKGVAEALIVTAGTSDLPVAEEAAETLCAVGLGSSRLTDVGVAGVHRVLSHHPALARASAIIVIAGMDGALPSLIGGLVAAPVIAVPTSTGYGASYGGLAALLTMLNSCAAGVVVVNIDNGFGAAIAAARILRD